MFRPSFLDGYKRQFLVDMETHTLEFEIGLHIRGVARTNLDWLQAEELVKGMCTWWKIEVKKRQILQKRLPYTHQTRILINYTQSH